MRAAQSGGGNGTSELCDGVDNDANGVIDDVDVGGDGVCDCLNIGTIGSIGPWSDGGNIFETWLNARTPLGAVPLADQPLTAELLAPLQVIVVLHVATEAVVNDDRMSPAHHAFSDAEASRVRRLGPARRRRDDDHRLHDDEAAEVVNVNRLLANVGMGYSATNLELTNFVPELDAAPRHRRCSQHLHRQRRRARRQRLDGRAWARATASRFRSCKPRAAESSSGATNGSRTTASGKTCEDQQVELFWLNILKWLSPPRTCQVPIPPDIPR